ncbi:hypothetical protein H0H93_000118 [Arthromyces matolae]|nr:hypothetical protein H0H93_000118 [Arthromyces matolae]
MTVTVTKNPLLLMNFTRQGCLFKKCRLPPALHARSYSAQPHKRSISSLSRYSPAIVGVGIVAGLSWYFFYPDASRSAPTLANIPLSPTHFTPSKVSFNEVCGPDTKLLELIVPPELLPRLDADVFAPIWSVFIKDDDIQVERPYTPLEGVDENGRMLFWIKQYPRGEVGRWLHSKNVGDTIELRGPLKTWQWKEDEWDEVVMISGGTGITPFYQLFSSVISRPSEYQTRFTLLHSSRTLADIPPPRIIDNLSSFAARNPERFRLKLFVDSPHGLPIPSHLPAPDFGRIGKPAIEQCLDLNQKTPWWHRLWRKSEAPKPNRKLIDVPA